MTKTKIILVTLALSLVIMAVAGVTYAQYANTQNQTGTYSQTPQGYTGNNGYLAPNGYYQVPQQGAHSNRMGIGMVMMSESYW